MTRGTIISSIGLPHATDHMSKELEFISVDDTDPDDEYAMNEGGYNPSAENSSADRIIGNSCLNQSKVGTWIPVAPSSSFSSSRCRAIDN